MPILPEYYQIFKNCTLHRQQFSAWKQSKRVKTDQRLHLATSNAFPGEKMEARSCFHSSRQCYPSVMQQQGWLLRVLGPLVRSDLPNKHQKLNPKGWIAFVLQSNASYEMLRTKMNTGALLKWLLFSGALPNGGKRNIRSCLR